MTIDRETPDHPASGTPKDVSDRGGQEQDQTKGKGSKGSNRSGNLSH
jgi:hypothetical protein